ncbi:MAG: MBL fold metallo-hydrolase [Bacilli bacterium]
MKTRLTYYGHSCFCFDNGYFSIVIDPFQNGSVPNLSIDKKIMANMVLTSHSHSDHFGIENVKITESPYRINIEKINSKHDKNNGLDRGDNIIHVFFMNNLKIAHLGDLGDIHSIEDIDKIKNVDLLLIPINGFYTIGSYEAYELINKINPKLIIPMHYYKKENQSGYKDDDQIEIFKKLFPDFIELNTNSFFIEDYLQMKKVLIV